MQRIDAAAAARIVLVVAPAGYGKSLALSHWLDRRLGNYMRFDVQTEHNTLLGFARGMAEACAQFPALRQTVATAFQNSASADAPGQEMARWMATHLESYTGVIAIDDFHRAGEDVEVSRFLAALIGRTKSHVQWVVSTRSTLDLPVASWLAYGDTHFVIGDRELTFLDEEALELSGGLGQALSGQALRGIMDATSGWPVALGLALRSGSVLSGGTDLSHSTREVLFQYLAEQVYSDLSTEERDVLHFAAYLPSIDVAVLEVAGYHTSSRVLEAVRRRATFLSLESPGKYACHDLFREFLRGQLERTNPAAGRRMQEKAADALERSGDTVAALRLYAQVRATDRILRILRSQGFDLMDHSHGDVVESALQAVPRDVRSSDAIILGLRAQRAADSGHFERAEALFKSALATDIEADVRLKLAIALALLLVNQSRSVDSLLGSLGTSDGYLDLRAEVAALSAVGSALLNEAEGGRERIRRAEELQSHVESPEVLSKILLRVGLAKMTLGGDGADVIHGLSESAGLAESLGMFGTAARAYNALGTAQLFYLNAPDETLKTEALAFDAASKSADRLALQSAIANSIVAHTNLGNEETLEPLLLRLDEVATSDVKRAHSVRASTRSTIAAWNGRFHEAALFVAELAASNYGYYEFDRLFNTACHALYAAAAGERSLSTDLLLVVTKRASQYFCPHPYATIKQGITLMFIGMAEYILGRRQHAAAALRMLPPNSPQAVVALRETLDCFCCGEIDLTEGISSLTKLTAGTGYAGIARTLKACMIHYGRLQKESRSRRFALTAAERQVLFDLERGATPKEIATRSGRSVHTVRTLIQRAMQKLGCRRRHEALTAARQFGLFAKRP